MDEVLEDKKTISRSVLKINVDKLLPQITKIIYQLQVKNYPQK